jgi:hypothetical protein
VSASRFIDAKFFDMTSDAHLIVDGQDKEHLIIRMGPSHIDGLEAALQKYRKTQETPLEP